MSAESVAGSEGIKCYGQSTLSLSLDILDVSYSVVQPRSTLDLQVPSDEPSQDTHTVLPTPWYFVSYKQNTKEVLEIPRGFMQRPDVIFRLC